MVGEGEVTTTGSLFKDMIESGESSEVVGDVSQVLTRELDVNEDEADEEDEDEEESSSSLEPSDFFSEEVEVSYSRRKRS